MDTIAITEWPFMLWAIALVAVVWIIPSRYQNIVLAVSGVVFISIYSIYSLLILVATSILTYFIVHGKNKTKNAVYLIFFWVWALLMFKFYNKEYSSQNMVLLLGFSYYMFRHIHYIIESMKGKLPTHSLVDYVSYQFFIPTLITGPIHRFPQFMKDAARRRWNTDYFVRGIERVIYGYFKIIVLGNYAVGFVLSNYQLKIVTDSILLREYIDLWVYGMKLYFLFAGYSDVAIGLALMMGYRIIENFNYPFLASNIRNFWERWHISLTSWCREYVYAPVAAMTRNSFISILATMLVIGLWHELSFKYIVWALYHGIGILVFHFWDRFISRFSWSQNKTIVYLRKILGGIITVNFVIIGFIFTKKHELSDVWLLIREIINSYV